MQKFLTTMLAGVGRAERGRHGSLYVQGLLLDGERKSIEPLAGRVPGADVQALQQFVGQSPWAWAPVRHHLAQRMEQALRPAAAWIVDDTGFPKQGHHSVAVARQYSGTLGKVGNCQVAVTVHLVNNHPKVTPFYQLKFPPSGLRGVANDTTFEINHRNRILVSGGRARGEVPSPLRLTLLSLGLGSMVAAGCRVWV